MIRKLNFYIPHSLEGLNPRLYMLKIVQVNSHKIKIFRIISTLEAILPHQFNLTLTDLKNFNYESPPKSNSFCFQLFLPSTPEGDTIENQ